MPRLEGAGRRRDGSPHRQEPLRRHRPGHDRDGGQRPDHRRRDAARRAGLLGRRRLRLVRRRRARRQALVAGWKRACEHLQRGLGRRRDAGAGRHRRGRPRSTSRPPAPASSARRTRLSLGDHLAPGDAIVLLASSGIHANGLSLARKLAERLPQGYLTPLTASAVPIALRRGPARADRPLLADHRGALFAAGVRVALRRQHHRPRLAQAACAIAARFTYRIRAVPDVPPVLTFIQREAGSPTRDAYGTFNMGAGFALFVAAEDAERSRSPWRARPASTPGSPAAWRQGRKRLVIEPLGARVRRQRARRSRSDRRRPSGGPPRIGRDGPPRMEARPTGSGRERSSPNRCNQCRGQARHLHSSVRERRAHPSSEARTALRPTSRHRQRAYLVGSRCCRTRPVSLAVRLSSSFSRS